MGTIIVGIIVGLVLGLTGAGGSVFALPLIVVFLGLQLTQAIGLSLGAVAFSAVFGTLLRLRGKDIQWHVAALFALLGAPLAPVGLKLNQLVRPDLVFLAFTGLVLVIALRLWRQTSREPEQSTQLRATLSHPGTETQSKEPPPRWQPQTIVKLSLGAIASGLLSGFFGVGGGFVIVPILLQGLKMPIKQAVATSLAVISAISTTGFIAFALNAPTLSRTLLLQISIGGLIGMGFGIMLSRHLAGPTLQRVFAVTMIVVALTTFLKEYVFHL